MSAVMRPPKPFPKLKVTTGLILGVAVIWSFVQVDAKWGRLMDGPGALWDIVKLSVDDWQWSDLSKCLRAMWDSVAMAWLGTILAAAVAVPLSLIAAENLVPRWFSLMVRQVFNLLRAVPEIVLVVAIVPILGLTKNAGVTAIAIGSIGSLAKLCSEIIEGIDPGPVEAVDSVGASALQRLRWSVIPQAAPEITSFVLYRFEINIRVSAILGVIGVGGIGGILNDNIKYKNWGIAGMAMVTVIVATILIDTLSGWIRRRILAGPSGTEGSDISAAHQADLLIGGSSGAV